MFKFLNTIGRYLGLLLLPVLVLPIVTFVVLGKNQTYTATASLWVERPLYVEGPNTLDGASYDSPARQLSSLLTELMGTRDFVSGIIDRTSRAASLKSDNDRGAAVDYVVKKTKIEANGWRLINISFTDDKSEGLALETLQVILTNFQSYYEGRINRQGEGALSYYREQVERNKQEFDKAQSAVVKFVTENSDKIGATTAGGPVTKEDLEFTVLTQARDAANKRYGEATDNLQRVQDSYTAYQQGQSVTLKVQDAPKVYDVGGGKLKQLALTGGIGLAAGLAIAALLTVILTLTDQTLRQPYQVGLLQGGIRVLELGEIKGFNKKKAKKGVLLVGLRQAMAGRIITSVPAPTITPLALSAPPVTPPLQTAAPVETVKPATARPKKAASTASPFAKLPRPTLPVISPPTSRDALARSLNALPTSNVRSLRLVKPELEEAEPEPTPVVATSDDTDLESALADWQTRPLATHWQAVYLAQLDLNVAASSHDPGLIGLVVGMNESGVSELLDVTTSGTRLDWAAPLTKLAARGVRSIDVLVTDGPEVAAFAEGLFEVKRQQLCLQAQASRWAKLVKRADRRELQAAVRNLANSPDLAAAQAELDKLLTRFAPANPKLAAVVRQETAATLAYYEFEPSLWTRLNNLGSLTNLRRSLQALTGQPDYEKRSEALIFAALREVEF